MKPGSVHPGEVTASHSVAQRPVRLREHVGVRTRCFARSYCRRVHRARADPVLVDFRQRQHRQTQRIGSGLGISRRHVYVHRLVGRSQANDLLPPGNDLPPGFTGTIGSLIPPQRVHASCTALRMPDALPSLTR